MASANATNSTSELIMVYTEHASEQMPVTFTEISSTSWYFHTFHWRVGSVDDRHRRAIGPVDGIAPDPDLEFPAPQIPSTEFRNVLS